MKLYDKASGNRSDIGSADGGEDLNPLWFEAPTFPRAHLPPEDFEVFLLRKAVGAKMRDRIFKKDDGMVFIGGSAMASLTGHARAAAAAGQFDAEGKLISGLTVVVPRGWPQTAAVAAERLALAWGESLGEEGVIPVVDCALRLSALPERG